MVPWGYGVHVHCSYILPVPVPSVNIPYSEWELTQTWTLPYWGSPATATWWTATAPTSWSGRQTSPMQVRIKIRIIVPSQPQSSTSSMNWKVKKKKNIFTLFEKRKTSLSPISNFYIRITAGLSLINIPFQVDISVLWSGRQTRPPYRTCTWSASPSLPPSRPPAPGWRRGRGRMLSCPVLPGGHPGLGCTGQGR